MTIDAQSVAMKDIKCHRQRPDTQQSSGQTQQINMAYVLRRYAWRGTPNSFGRPGLSYVREDRVVDRFRTAAEAVTRANERVLQDCSTFGYAKSAVHEYTSYIVAPHEGQIWSRSWLIFESERFMIVYVVEEY